MMITKTRFSFVAAMLCAALTGACSDGVTRLSPNTPSNIDAPAVAADGTTLRPSSAGDEAAEWAVAHGWRASADGLVVEGTDVITATSGVCPTATITVRGVPVALTAATTYTAPATCAGLTAGTTVAVKGLLTFTAGGFTVAATSIAFPAGAPPAAEEKVNGIVASSTGECPAVTITLEGAGGIVVTSATTTYVPAGSCGTIAAGKTVKATGTRNATGQLIATRFEIITATTPTPPTGGGGKKVGGEGVIGSITGTCPTRTVVIGGSHVQITAATEFAGGTCASLRSGTQVKVDAEVQTDGSILAEKVEIKKIPGRPVSGDGKVDSVVGTCPDLTISVKGVIVKTSASTSFSGGTCEAITSGTHIDVAGDYDGVSVAATAVAIRNTGRR